VLLLRDAVDLGIDRGIRKACYTTPLIINSSSELDSDQHTSAIAQVIVSFCFYGFFSL
jgi:hypothetical protein